MLANSQSQSHSSVATDSQKQTRVLTGTVTKLLENFGFIDDSVFFQLSVVKGGDVHVGDKVYCECSYSEHLPFKWNATKVHLVQSVQSNARNNSSSSATPGAASQSNSSSQVASTYLQHRLQQQQSQQSRDDSSNPMPGLSLNQSHSYYTSSSSATPAAQPYQPQSQFDYAKTQQAVAAAQQLAQYYARSDQNNFNQLQYTSTPGSAFVSSSLPFTQQIQSNLLSTQRQQQPQNSFKNNSSRWGEREERINREERFRNRDDRNRFNDTPRARNDDRNNDREFERDRSGGLVKDEFGRDIRRGDRDRKERELYRQPEREVEKERDRDVGKRDKEVRAKRSVSPSVSIGSQSALRLPRRRYDPINIPKLSVLKSPLNVYEIKSRYTSNLHVPSDLKEVIINTKFSLNINEIPKPITFRVIDVKDEKKRDSPKRSSDTSEKKSDDNKNNKHDSTMEVDKQNDSQKDKEKAQPEQPIALKLNHKYGVKVLILSLPSMADIYDRAFGSDFDAINSGSKAYFLHFNKLLAFLVSRNANDGFSLIGGKFNAQLDGYITGTEEPNLIATAIRVVAEHTGMNLTKCGKWRLIATFVYNRDSSVDPLTPSLEFTSVYMPDIWSAIDSIYDEIPCAKNENTTDNLEANNNENVLDNDMIEINNNANDDDKCDLVNADTNNVNNSNNINDPEEQPIPLLEQQEDSPSVKLASPDTAEDNDSSAMDLSQPNPSEVVEFTDNDSQPEANVECSSSPLDDTTINSSEVNESTPKTAPDSADAQLVDMSANVDNNDSPSVDNSNSQEQPTESSATETVQQSPATAVSSDNNASELQNLLSRLNEMKVTELRTELEKRGARFKSNLKKAELVSKLKQMVEKLLDDEDTVSDEVKGDWWAQRILSKESHSDVDESSQIDSINDNKVIESDNDNDNENADKTSEPQSNVKNDSACEPIDSSEKMAVDETSATVDNEDSNINVAKTGETDPQVDDQNTQSSDKEKTTENAPIKRKTEITPEVQTKKARNGDDLPQEQLIPKKVVDGCVYVKGGENLTVITLHEALNHQRYDQFEMSVVSEVMRESLIHHFSHYILSALVYNHQNPPKKDDKATNDGKQNALQVNYVHLSFAYFDSSHCGHLLSDDLLKLLSNANFTLSKRAFNLLTNNEEKVQYRDLCEPEVLLDIKKSNENNIFGSNSQSNANQVCLFEKNGTTYDVNTLIDQSEKDEKLKVKLNEQLSSANEKTEQLKEYISELESKQRKMTTATEKQNDEICLLKREREILKNKYDSMRKLMETSTNAFTDLLKSQSDEKNN